MKKNTLQILTKRLTFLFFIAISFTISAQENPEMTPKSEFWKKVQFGGGLGLGFGSGYTNISVSPTAIYNINSYVALGTGVQYSFLKQKGFFSSNIYGASFIALFNPIEEIQLSTEVEQLRVNRTFEGLFSGSENFWNTGLFVGAGYRMDNVTIGARYNLFFKTDNGVYGDAFMPFVRVFF
ncbi:hypothetical protein [Flavobacterium sp.]|uniref:hypothetical protein n=1 Tax=Flavobacterium sp. TaxID=239 RepID=UPI0026178168|nr:hypothetical protein [Flavobacterium sp.]